MVGQLAQASDEQIVVAAVAARMRMACPAGRCTVDYRHLRLREVSCPFCKRRLHDVQTELAELRVYRGEIVPADVGLQPVHVDAVDQVSDFCGCLLDTRLL